jgi:hypothetical protein
MTDQTVRNAIQTVRLPTGTGTGTDTECEINLPLNRF